MDTVTTDLKVHDKFYQRECTIDKIFGYKADKVTCNVDHLPFLRHLNFAWNEPASRVISLENIWCVFLDTTYASLIAFTCIKLNFLFDPIVNINIRGLTSSNLGEMEAGGLKNSSIFSQGHYPKIFQVELYY